MAYQYTPLPPGTIRLLSLSPSPSKTAPLQGTFLSIPLSSPSPTSSTPPFSALSYVWGAQTFPSTIKILSTGNNNLGTDLPLPTTNLSAALRRFRLPDVPRLLWADAICINQQDISERNAQVLLMADIYRTAETTLCWLGVGDTNSEGALRALGGIAELGPMFGQGARGMPPERGQPVGSELDVGGMDVEGAREVVELAVGGRAELVFGNEWFERLWIVQEAVLAREMRMVLGEAEVDWDVFEAAATLVFRAVKRTGRPFTGMKALGSVVGLLVERSRQGMFRRPEGVDHISGEATSGLHSRLLEMVLKKQHWGKGEKVFIMPDRPQRFLETIWGLRHRKCGDDRDRVYATRSFIPWDVPVNVEVDYSKTVVEVYTAFARALLNANTMDILLVAGFWDRETMPTDDGGTDDEAPSWVCDFRLAKLRHGTREPWRNPLYDYDETTMGVETPGVRWPDTSPTSRRVQLESVVVDEVVSVVPPPPLDPKNGTFSVSTCLCLRFHLLREAKYPDSTPEELPTKEETALFCRVLGVDTERFPGVVDLVGRLVATGREEIRPLVKDRGLDIGQEWNITWRFGARFTQGDSNEMSRLSGRLPGVSFFITKKGHVGTGPGILGRGDKLVRFMGLFTPCMVRPVGSDEEHRLIGGCYVHDEVDVAGEERTWLTLV